MNFRVIATTILTTLILPLGQKYTYADENTQPAITKPVMTNVYIFRHGRIDKKSDYLELKEESEKEIINSAEEISCDSDTSQNYKIFYLVKDSQEESNKRVNERFKQTADQI